MIALHQCLIHYPGRFSANSEATAGVLSKRLVLSIALSFICACGTWAQADEPTARTWRLKGSNLQLRLRTDGLIIEKARARFFSPSKPNPRPGDPELDAMPSFIPFSSITAVIKEVVSHKPVQTAIDNALKEVKTGDATLFPDLYGDKDNSVILAANAGAMLPFRGVKTHIQSVRILWIESGVPRSTNFILSARDSESLSSHLGQMTGRVRTTVNFENEARDEHASQMAVHFPQPVSVGPYTVWGGTYNLLLLKCSDGTNLVYFFSSNKQMPQDALLTLTATSSPLGSEKPWKVKLMRDLDGSFCFTEIDTNSERLQVRACSFQAEKHAELNREWR